MSQTVMFITFKLAQGAVVPDFLQAAEKVNREFMSKQKGYISWKQLRDGDNWADMLIWETAQDAQNTMAASESYPGAGKFFAFLDMESVNMKLYTVEKSYQ